jgi:hypothetical protein
MKKLEPVNYVVMAIVLIIILFFTLYSFFINMPCDIDKVYLWCRQTGTFADIIGNILFYSGAIVLSGVTNLFGLEIYDEVNSAKYQTITFVVLVLSFILIWNL